MQQIFTEHVSCITYEVYTGKGWMWGFGCLVCLQPACLSSYNALPPWQTTGIEERLEVSLALC